MPSIRVGFSSDLNIRGGKVGFGTTNLTANLEVAGQITAEDAAGSGGVSTFREYQGFSQSEARISNNVTIDNSDGGPFSSLTGEIKITGETTVSSGSTVEVGKTKTLTVTDRFAVPLGDTNDRDNTPEPGTTRFNQDFGTLEFFDGVSWKTVNSYARYHGGTAGRAVVAGGERGPASSRVIDYFNMNTMGDSINFGDLVNTTNNQTGANSSSTRGLIYIGSAANTIEYVTIASSGNAIEFGSTAVNDREQVTDGCSSSTRGLFGGGLDNPVVQDIIEYNEIATLGNALDFGDLSVARFSVSAFQSPTRGYFANGYNNQTNVTFNIVDTVKFASLGDATDFGDTTRAGRGSGACSNRTRGVVFAGSLHPNSFKDICITTMASGGSFVDFGFLSTNRNNVAGASSHTRGFSIGGDSTNVIESILFSSSGGVTDFGDLIDTTSGPGGLSDSHGGLGGF